MRECSCSQKHHTRRVVLTGGPGAGKTAVLELLRQRDCRHVRVLPEAASILFRGGFLREPTVSARCAAQSAIFHVQRSLESLPAPEENLALVLCDRGTVDGAAYWPGPSDFFQAMGTTREAELARYDAVLHLRTPGAGAYNHRNQLRTETAQEAAAIDERIAVAWAGHPGYVVVDNAVSFLEKAHRALALLATEVPACCRAP